MPFATGTAATPSVLLNAINTHLIANSWTNLRGETDMACASPKTARYWRLMVWETETTTDDFRELKHFGLRTAVGGANVATTGANMAVSSINTGLASDLVTTGGTAIVSANITDQAWWCTYDFGVGTIVREIVLEVGTDGRAPRDFAVQWSNDNITWTTMFQQAAQAWIDNETLIFTFDDLFLFADHQSGTEPRRAGNAEDMTSLVSTITTPGRHFSEDVWTWQGPGYDAARRVYIHARAYYDLAASTHGIEWDFSVEADPLKVIWNENEGSTQLGITHLMDSGTVTYWIYSNSKRIVLITLSGSQDYTSSYVGFTSAFATPQDFPFPLYVGSTSPDVSAHNSAESNARLSSIQDPGLECGMVRLWDGTLKFVENRPVDASAERYLISTPTRETWMWPMYFGSTGRGNWPAAHGSDWADGVPAHMFQYIVPTQQNHLPLFPATIMNDPYGNVGVLDGVFSIPGGSALSPEQIITISGQDYKVFPNRTRRLDTAWFCVRED